MAVLVQLIGPLDLLSRRQVLQFPCSQVIALSPARTHGSTRRAPTFDLLAAGRRARLVSSPPRGPHWPLIATKELLPLSIQLLLRYYPTGRQARHTCIARAGANDRRRPSPARAPCDFSDERARERENQVTPRKRKRNRLCNFRPGVAMPLRSFHCYVYIYIHAATCSVASYSIYLHVPRKF